jgi:hypothetical protein
VQICLLNGAEFRITDRKLYKSSGEKCPNILAAILSLANTMSLFQRNDPSHANHRCNPYNKERERQQAKASID